MQTCSACTHSKRAEIDSALVAGVPSLRNIAKHHGLSVSALFRHKDHLAPALALAKEAGEIAAADTLLQRIEGLIGDCKGIVEKALAAKEYSSAVRALGEVRQSLELLGQVSGELKRGKDVQVAVQVTDSNLGPLTPSDRHAVRFNRRIEVMSDEELRELDAKMRAVIESDDDDLMMPPVTQ